MKIFIRILLVCSALPIMAVDCRSDVKALSEISEVQKAVIVFAGDPAVDGCGWLLNIENKLYAPVNLNAKFQVDSLTVSVKYEIQSGTWNCGWRSPGYQKIDIKEIKEF
ncbi:hypothetical protein [Leadbetterella byssophila]|uniref:Lipoprotein n=1 Tax=Leadbetterella byssophila (strain DSM 17132 / JCM 16389 / KACC 11308 / NBRC 106382 / 4M15) TaxID=649349 RepID=E4RX45_LEAB4|nr:hypothetical protein [Leadbetterella byssophila]ADQ18084.1 hypothetical protein Lbys_2414 [Leadbetterella byssophila DSM 17132]